MTRFKNGYFYIGLAFFVIPFIIWCVCLGIFIKNVNIAKHGTETTAVVIGYSSNVEVNGEKIYKVGYEFEDTNGVKHTGHSSSRYSYSIAKNMETIKIRYNKNFESIEADFGFTYQMELWFLPIFFVIGASFIFAFVVDIVNKKQMKRVLQFGTETEGRFVETYSNVSINDVKMYKIVYEYDNEYGDVITRKTSSCYPYEQAMYYQNLGKFKIKYLKGKSAIVESYNAKSASELKDKQSVPLNMRKKRCLYCDSIVDYGENKCTNCGSKKLKDV